ncbi:hypothetical protein [Nannocystis punicea]|uniref:Uncharacterized protein n=1 Tax=Nannocystis punicea TaxID=2995304 RepID=A0ABY7H4D2_9BACT|nr:hypothetical protein [Nannocystis poenicansa]WAS94140.1 hypothetical protein O0S08_49085 [Nannocystis poenicansa]
MTNAPRRSRGPEPRRLVGLALVIVAACTPPVPAPVPPLPQSQSCPRYTQLRRFEADTPLVGPIEGEGLPSDLAGTGRWKASRRTDTGTIALYVAEALDGLRLSLVRFDAQLRQVGPAVLVARYPDPNTWTIWHAHLAWWPGGVAVSWALSPIARHGATRHPHGFVALLTESAQVLGAAAIGPVHVAPVLTVTSQGIEVLHDDARRNKRRTAARLTCDRLMFPTPPQ